MSEEVRYAIPYMSGLRLTLHEFVTAIPVVDTRGKEALARQVSKPGLAVDLTTYIGNAQGSTETIEFPGASTLPEGHVPDPADMPTMEELFTSVGVDVAAAWQTALDSMANVFPLLQDPAEGAEAYGPKRYLRLDSWIATIPANDRKSVTAVIGVYKEPECTTAEAYISLTFADGDTLRDIDQRKATHQANIDYANSILADPPTFPNWAEQTQERKDELTAQAHLALKSNSDALAELNAQLIGRLEDLLALESVSTSVGALAAGTFTALKEKRPAWSDIDVSSIMANFALPTVS